MCRCRKFGGLQLLLSLIYGRFKLGGQHSVSHTHSHCQKERFLCFLRSRRPFYNGFLLLQLKVLCPKSHSRNSRGQASYRHSILDDIPHSLSYWQRTTISRKPLIWSANFDNRMLLLAKFFRRFPQIFFLVDSGSLCFFNPKSIGEPRWNSWNQRLPQNEVSGASRKFYPVPLFPSAQHTAFLLFFLMPQAFFQWTALQILHSARDRLQISRSLIFVLSLPHVIHSAMFNSSLFPVFANLTS